MIDHLETKGAKRDHWKMVHLAPLRQGYISRLSGLFWLKVIVTHVDFRHVWQRASHKTVCLIHSLFTEVHAAALTVYTGKKQTLPSAE